MSAGTRNRGRDRNRTRTRERRPKTVSLSLQDRGQTTQDFAIGIGVFILAVAFVFSFLPSIVTPYDSSVGGAETAQADRVADRLVQNLSIDESPNEINGRPIVDGTWNDSQLANLTGLRSTTSDGGDTVRIDKVNVTIQHLNGSTVEHTPVDGVGPAYADQPAASSARIVSVAEPGGFNDPAYRLLVRVW